MLEAAVIAIPDLRGGEGPAAYVTLKEDASATEQELIEHVGTRPVWFRAPGAVTFGQLPKTATGKIDKVALRDEARAAAQRRIP